MPKTSGSSARSPFRVPSLANNAAEHVSATTLHRLPHEHNCAFRPWDRTAEKHESPNGVDIDDVQIEQRHSLSTHASRHFPAFEHPRRRRTCADRTGRAVHPVHTMAGDRSGEVVALDHTLETLAF